MSLLTLAWRGPVAAQEAPRIEDDWALTREPAAPPVRRARKLDAASQYEQLYRALLESPGSDDALARLRTAELARHGTLSALLVRLRAESTSHPRAAAPRQALARVLLAEGQVDEALSVLERAATEADDVVGSLLLRARVLGELGRHGEAAAQLHTTSALARGRQAASVEREAAREELADGQSEQALESLRRARELGGASYGAELRTLTRAALQQAGRTAELAEQLEREQAPREAAELWLEQGDSARAIAALKLALRRAPADRAARTMLVRALMEAGQPDAARREAAEVLQRAPDEPEALTSWAELSRDLGDRELALRKLEQTSARKPHATALHRALYALYLRWSEPARAEHELELLSALEPAEPAHRVALADQALARGDRALALKWLERTGETSAHVDAELARNLGERDFVPEAVERAQRAVARAPAVPEYRRQLASLLERAGRAVDAERVLLELVSSSSGAVSREARQRLVSLWRRVGSDRLRAGELEAKLRADPHDSASLHLLVALLAMKPEQRARQRELVEQLLALAPDDVEALLWRERAQLDARDVEGAMQTRERLLSTAEGSEHTRGALELARNSPRQPAVPVLMAHALTLSPQVGELSRLAGDVWQRRGELALASAAYERAVALDDRDDEARLAWAELLLASGKSSAGEAQLVAVVERSAHSDPGTADEPTTTAARLLLRSNAARGEAVLARGAVDDARLHVLLAHYAATLLPSARRVLAGAATSAERARLREAVTRAQAGLVRAIGSVPASSQTAAPLTTTRQTALTLLAAAPPASAVQPLLRLAEQADAPPRERSLALVGLGRTHDARIAARLRVLLGQVGRPLRPVTLWAAATCAPVEAAEVLAEATHDRDPVMRGLAHALTTSPRAVGPDELFADSPAQRELASRWLTHPPARAIEPPAPEWPFDLAAFPLAQQRAALDESGPASVRPEHWLAVVERTVGRLRDPALQHDTLQQLRPNAGGLIPRALLENAVCVSETSARQLARALEPTLLTLLVSQEDSLALAAQSLLVTTGAHHPELTRRLQGGDSPLRRALLRSLADVSPIPVQLLAPLRELRLHAPDWPTRLWAARALRGDAAPLAHDPVALVERAGELPAPPPGPSATCSSPDPVVN